MSDCADYIRCCYEPTFENSPGKNRKINFYLNLNNFLENMLDFAVPKNTHIICRCVYIKAT